MKNATATHKPVHVNHTFEHRPEKPSEVSDAYFRALRQQPGYGVDTQLRGYANWQIQETKLTPQGGTALFYPTKSGDLSSVDYTVTLPIDGSLVRKGELRPDHGSKVAQAVLQELLKKPVHELTPDSAELNADIEKKRKDDKAAPNRVVFTGRLEVEMNAPALTIKRKYLADEGPNHAYGPAHALGPIDKETGINGDAYRSRKLQLAEMALGFVVKKALEKSGLMYDSLAGSAERDDNNQRVYNKTQFPITLRHGNIRSSISEVVSRDRDLVETAVIQALMEIGFDAADVKFKIAGKKEIMLDLAPEVIARTNIRKAQNWLRENDDTLAATLLQRHKEEVRAANQQAVNAR